MRKKNISNLRDYGYNSNFNQDRGRKEEMVRSKGVLPKGPRKKITEELYLEHRPILEDMLLITHHTILIQSWNSLLCILHDLEREDMLLNLLEVKT